MGEVGVGSLRWGSGAVTMTSRQTEMSRQLGLVGHEYAQFVNESCAASIATEQVHT
jgi:hypothetical protein